MSRPEPPGPWDAGLQPERTSLAWRRTCLTLAGVGLLVARAFLAGGSWVALGLVVTLVATGAALVWWLAERRAHVTVESLRDVGGMAAGPGGRLLLVLACCAFAVAVANGVLVLVLDVE
jgi:hypothetical protein